MAGILLNSGFFVFFQSAIVFVTIISWAVVIPEAMQSLVCGLQAFIIESNIFSFLYGVSIKS